MRVVAGRFGGRRLRPPPDAGVRPTSDRVREALFAQLGVLEDARVLDLYAGTGALGIEALSRGAAQATFVERSAASLASRWVLPSSRRWRLRRSWRLEARW